jgi:hypothetical protein
MHAEHLQGGAAVGQTPLRGGGGGIVEVGLERAAVVGLDV